VRRSSLATLPQQAGQVLDLRPGQRRRDSECCLDGLADLGGCEVAPGDVLALGVTHAHSGSDGASRLSGGHERRLGSVFVLRRR